MPISHSDSLFELIQSLSASEKKSFKAYAGRLQDKENVKYVQLFDILDKMDRMDDKILMQKMGKISKSKLSNLKRHLFKQILNGIKPHFVAKIPELEVREYIDYADILHAKGLIIQAIKVMKMALHMSEKAQLHQLKLEIYERIKDIESRNITRTGATQVDIIVQESSDLIDSVHTSIKLSNLKLILHTYYINHGHIQNQEDFHRLTSFYEQTAPSIEVDALTHGDQILYYQAQVWYYYILLNFDSCMTSAKAWVHIMERHSERIALDPNLYMRGLHYVLTSAYYISDKATYEQYFDKLTLFRKNQYSKFTFNNKVTSFLYLYLARFNQYFIRQDYAGAIDVIPKTLQRLHRYRDYLDEHRIMVFYFKIAFAYLMAGDSDKAISFLHRIMTMEIGGLRQDIQIYTRLMFLMAHYSSGDWDQMDYVLQQMQYFFKKNINISHTQNTILHFFKTIVNTPLLHRKEVLYQFGQEVQAIKSNFYEQRAYLYLDIEAWINMEKQKA